MNPFIEAIRDYCSAHRIGLTGTTAPTLTGWRIEFPVLWYEPVELTGKDGTHEGTVTYRIRFRLLERNRNLSEDQKDTLLHTLEQRIFDLVARLHDHEKILTVQIASSAPQQSHHTHYGELGWTVTLRGEAWFSNDLT